MIRPIILSAAALTIVAIASCGADRNSTGNSAATDRISNPEAVIPPQCYTRTESRYNPCYTCHQSHAPGSRPNTIKDGVLQGEYTFTDTAQTNHWRNLFVDRSEAVAAISDSAVLDYINKENYTDLHSRLENNGWAGYMPDLENLHLGAAAFDAAGFALDGSGWVAFNYKPLPSTFWPTNGSTDDVFIRLPARFRRDSEGNDFASTYKANLAILEAAIKDLPTVEFSGLNENELGTDLNGDGVWGPVSTIERPGYYLGEAAAIAVTPFLYPEGVEFLHSVRYIGVDGDGGISIPARMKELRYMRKIRFYSPEHLASLYDNERQDRIDGLLPNYVSAGDWGLDNGFGWQVLGFIEDAEGKLRPQNREENLFCMGCHSTLGATIDQTFAFPRKVTGSSGWGYIDLHGMPDAPTLGESDGEFLQYLRRVGGGDEFRQNREMLKRFFNADGGLNEAAVAATADVYELIAPSRERALELDKAYWNIVREQDFIHGRDATVTPATHVFEVVDPESAPLPVDKQLEGDIRLSW